MVILCGTVRSPGHCLGATTAAWPFLADRLDNLPPVKHLLLWVEIKVKGNASFLIRGMQVCMSIICLENERDMTRLNSAFLNTHPVHTR